MAELGHFYGFTNEELLNNMSLEQWEVYRYYIPPEFMLNQRKRQTEPDLFHDIPAVKGKRSITR